MQKEQKVLNKLRELLVINNPYYTKSDNEDFLLLKKWVSLQWRYIDLKSKKKDDINDLYTTLQDIRNYGCVNGIEGLIYNSTIEDNYYIDDLLFYTLQQIVSHLEENEGCLKIKDKENFTPYVWTVIELDAYNVLSQVEDGD
jgi:hypothetical protein